MADECVVCKAKGVVAFRLVTSQEAPPTSARATCLAEDVASEH